MGGITSLGEGIRLVLVPAILFLLIAFFALRKKIPRGSLLFIASAFLSLMLLFTIVFGWGFIGRLRQHEVLSHLKADQVQSITVGSTEIDDPAQLRAIVNALRKSEWFVSRYVAYTARLETVDFRIRLKSGDTYAYRIAAERRERGILIEFPPNSADGAAPTYSRSTLLGTALSDAGVTLAW